MQFGFNMDNKTVVGQNSANNTILIAEDCVVMIRLLSRLLQSKGYSVVGIAENGIEAIRLFMETNPQIVIMDINMPSMNGLDATRAICKIKPDAKVVIVSMETSRNMILKAMKCGAVNYIAKPIKAAHLFNIIDLLANN
jgi:two-component system, chemotaxis family, chemotaxis protein CheY